MATVTPMIASATRRSGTFDDKGRYMPAGSRIVRCKVSGAFAFVYDHPVYGPAYRGFRSQRKAKPDVAYRYTSAAKRDEAAAQFLANCRAWAERKAADRAKVAEAKAAGHGLAVGDILYTSWGYEQTNVDWFEVVALHGKTGVSLRPLCSDMEPTGPMSGRTMPRRGEYRGDAVRKRVSINPYGVTVKIHSSAIAYKWDGTPKHASWGH